MGGWLLFLGICGGVIGIAALVQKAIRANAWPEPAPKLHTCPECAKEFSNWVVLSYHHRAEHLQVPGPLAERMPQRSTQQKRRTKRARRHLKLVEPR